jgi:hypothetical protein
MLMKAARQSTGLLACYMVFALLGSSVCNMLPIPHFLTKDLSSVMNLKWIIFLTEQISGMRNYFYKCDMVPDNTDSG